MANRANQRAFHEGRLTADVERRAQIVALQTFGRVQSGSEDDRRLQHAPVDAFRSLACEWAATKEVWSQRWMMNPNSVRDLFHVVVALPYTNAIVTYDRRLRQIIAAVRQAVSFPVATEHASISALLSSGT